MLAGLSLPGKAARVYLALAMGLTAAAYARAPTSGWVWDDEPAIVNGRLIGSLANIPEVFAHDSSWNSYKDGLGDAAINTYRPIPMVTLMVDHALWGKRPAGFHVTSVLLHLLNVLLVFAIARRLGLSPPAAGLAAALFGVHPATSEVAHWVSARYDLVCLLFFLAALLLWLPSRDAPRPSVPRLLAVGLLVFAASLSKEAAFLLTPGLVLLLPRVPLRRVAVLLLPWVAGLALGFSCRLAVLNRPAVGEGTGHFVPALARLPVMLLDGVRSLVLPSARLEPSLVDAYRAIGGARLAVAMLLVGSLLAISVVRWRRGRPLTAWALVTLTCALAPVALLASHPNWSGWGRYLYPVAPAFSITFAALVADELATWLPARAARWLPVGVVCGLLLCGFQTFAATSIWRDHLSFHLAQIDEAPDRVQGYYGAGLELSRQGRFAEALPYAIRCTETAQDFAGCWMVLGTDLSALGRKSEAELALRRSLRLDPAQHQARFILGYILLERGLQADAGRYFVDALAGEPGHEGRWQTVTAAARTYGPSSPLVLEMQRLAATGRFGSVGGRLATLGR